MNDGSDAPKKKKVGYKSPPEGTQFKKGVSGNLLGREKKNKKEQSKSGRALILDVMMRTMTVNINGQRESVTAPELALLQLIGKMGQGDKAACKLVLEIYMSLQKTPGGHFLPSHDNPFSAKEQLRKKLGRLLGLDKENVEEPQAKEEGPAEPKKEE